MHRRRTVNSLVTTLFLFPLLLSGELELTGVWDSALHFSTSSSLFWSCVCWLSTIIYIENMYTYIVYHKTTEGCPLGKSHYINFGAWQMRSGCLWPVITLTRLKMSVYPRDLFDNEDFFCQHDNCSNLLEDAFKASCGHSLCADCVREIEYTAGVLKRWAYSSDSRSRSHA